MAQRQPLSTPAQILADLSMSYRQIDVKRRTDETAAQFVTVPLGNEKDEAATQQPIISDAKAVAQPPESEDAEFYRGLGFKLISVTPIEKDKASADADNSTALTPNDGVPVDVTDWPTITVRPY